MDRETARDLLPAYALGALEDAERRELQELLADWPEGRAELAGLIATVDALPYALEEERPSLGLEGRIITRARAQREPWRRPRAAAPPRRVLRWLPHLMAASFAAAAAVLGVFAFTGGDEVIAGRWFDLPTTDNAAAYITYFDERPIGVLFRGLEPPPEERVYQLWRLRADDSRAIVDTFVPRPDGWAAVAIVLGEDEAVVGFGLTIEPLDDLDAAPSTEFPPITFPVR